MKTTKSKIRCGGMLAILALALGLTTEFANADFTFGTPTNLGPIVNTSSGDWHPSISADGLSLYFNSNRPGGYGGYDLWVTTRETTDDPWGAAVNLGPTVNSSRDEVAPSISADGLSLYFSDPFNPRPGGYGSTDIWVTTRATTEDDWGTPVNLEPPVNSSADEIVSCISPDGLQLYFCDYQLRRPGGLGGFDLWVTTRATTDDEWGEPVNLGPSVNSSSNEMRASISAEGLALYFQSDRPGGSGHWDLWVTTRASISDPWGASVNLGPIVNSSASDESPSISADGLTLYFSDFPEARPGGVGSRDLWQVSIEPVVDLNADGIVDSADIVIMIDYWGTDNPLCDIGPMPWGDGIVDVQDLIILAEHLFEEVFPVELIAYWKLDEIEGTIAEDSVGELDGTVYGQPLWQPEAGIVGGALEFDGIDDYVSIPSFMSTANSSLSVFAWIKGGMPGQVIISQKGRSNWLLADTTEGSLMTELKFLGMSGVPLYSHAVITDGNWHRVGLVWDGSNRILYVDDVEVVSDTYDKGRLFGRLQIGAGMNLDPGTFWSGLIDDVRIYNRAVSP